MSNHALPFTRLSDETHLLTRLNNETCVVNDTPAWIVGYVDETFLNSILPLKTHWSHLSLPSLVSAVSKRVSI